MKNMGVLILIAAAGSANAASEIDEFTAFGPPLAVNASGNRIEEFNTGWSAVTDNDLFARGADSDQDYTGGFAITLGGYRAAKYRFSLDPALGWINGRLDKRRTLSHLPTTHAVQFGVLAFTPDDLQNSAPVLDGRPYANLFYMSNSRFALDDRARRAYQTTLTIGVLGAGIGQSLQSTLHDVLGGVRPAGYDHQISDGGEFTARYSLARRSLLLTRIAGRGRSLELQYELEGGIGYLTGGTASFAMRWGKIATPWWKFSPTRSNYLPEAPPRFQQDHGGGMRESYVWASASLNGRAYDAFLQGQFRDSDVTFEGRDLNHVIGKLSLGWTVTLSRSLTLTQSIHYQTKQIRHGTGARDQLWGSLSIAKNF